MLNSKISNVKMFSIYTTVGTTHYTAVKRINKQTTWIETRYSQTYNIMDYDKVK